jgi:hypothetical protein
VCAAAATAAASMIVRQSLLYSLGLDCDNSTAAGQLNAAMVEMIAVAVVSLSFLVLSFLLAGSPVCVTRSSGQGLLEWQLTSISCWTCWSPDVCCSSSVTLFWVICWFTAHSPYLG